MAITRTKVIHIITRLDRGGSAENTLLTVIGLDKTRHEITLISGPSQNPPQLLMDKAQSSGVKFIVVDDLIREISPWRDLKALWAVRRTIKGADVVHTHSSKAGILGRWAAALARVPCIVHTPHGHVFYGYYGKIISRFFIILEKITARFSDKIIALTQREIADYLALGMGRPEKFTVIHSGVELDNFRLPDGPDYRLKTGLGIPQTAPVVGSVGRLEEVKGYKYLIEAAALIIKEIPDVYFLLAGDGSLRAELTRLCRELGLESRFIFHGWQEEVAKAMSIMDVFVLSSLNEGMGKVLVGAMALRKPIVATSVGGVPELIKDGQNGLLIPPRNPSALAEAVIKLLRNPDQAQALAIRANQGVEQYSAGNMIRKIEELYENVYR